MSTSTHVAGAEYLAAGVTLHWLPRCPQLTSEAMREEGLHTALAVAVDGDRPWHGLPIDLTTDELQTLVVGYLGVSFVTDYLVSLVMPDPEAFAHLYGDHGTGSPASDRAQWVASMRTPHPTSAWVRPDRRRTGIATALYLAAADQLSRQGLVLRASAVRSPAAERLWESFEGNPEARLAEWTGVTMKGMAVTLPALVGSGVPVRWGSDD